MTDQTGFLSGKGPTDENFPVASWLIAPRQRGVVLAFYRFARAADDAADHPALPAADKRAILDALEATLLGRADSRPEALPLRAALAKAGLSSRHPLELLIAFRADVDKRRYRDFDELMGYCRYSASPVGRFVLDAHGESEALWPASDALCAALQIINHLQDFGRDCRNLDRVYLPLDHLAAERVDIRDLGANSSGPGLRRCVLRLTKRVDELLDQSEIFASRITGARLGCEVAVIQRLARRLSAILATRDPLRDKVHLSRGESVARAIAAIAAECGARLRIVRPGSAKGVEGA